MEVSTIDFFLRPMCVDEKVVEVVRMDEVHANVSDHLPVCCTFQAELSRAIKSITKPQRSTRVKWKRINKEEYEEKVAEQLPKIRGDVKKR